MKIPKKISPDRIKDAIVEIRYLSKIPFEVIVGLFYNALDESYYYTNKPIKKQQVTANNIPQEITLSLGGQSFFYNKLIKIQLQPNSIIFNCLDEYISWQKYFPEIEKAMNQFNKANIIEYYTRIGIRYISEYIDLELKECIKFNFTFGMPEIKSSSFTFKSEFMLDELRVIINLNNKISIDKLSTTSTNQSHFSVDIDVIRENMQEPLVSELLSKIEKSHQKEKELFFNLIREDFLKTLNPEY